MEHVVALVKREQIQYLCQIAQDGIPQVEQICIPLSNLARQFALEILGLLGYKRTSSRFTEIMQLESL